MMIFPHVDMLEDFDGALVRGTAIIGINGIGRYVGRDSVGVDWIAWDRSHFVTMCAAFDDQRARRTRVKKMPARNRGAVGVRAGRGPAED